MNRRGFIASLLASAAAVPAMPGMIAAAFAREAKEPFGPCSFLRSDPPRDPRMLVVPERLYNRLRAEVERSYHDGWQVVKPTGRIFGRLYNGQEVEVRRNERLPT